MALNNQKTMDTDKLLRCPTCGAHTKCPSEDLAIDVARLRTQLQILQDAVNRMAGSGNLSSSQSLQSTEEQEAKTSLSRVKYTISRIGENGKRLETSGTSPSPSKTTRPEPEFAFEVKEFHDDKGNITAHIVLVSSGLREVVYRVLKKHFEHSKDIKWAEREPSLSLLKAPFTPLLSYWRELTMETHLKEAGNVERERQEDLKILLQHVRDMQPDLVLQIESPQDARRISWEHLDIVFRPGTFVVARPYLDQPQIFKIHSVSIESEDYVNVVVVKCWAYDWKDTQLVRVYYDFKIENFVDEKEIKDLPCYPIQYYEDGNGNRGLEALKNKLITRGKFFRKICTKPPGAKSMFFYKGVSLEFEQSIVERNFMVGRRIPWNVRECLISEPIMVDFKSLLHECHQSFPIGEKLTPSPYANPCNCPLCLDVEDQKWMTRFSETPEDGAEHELDMNYLLLPSRVLGYSFKTRRFAQFSVDKVETVVDEHPGQDFDKNLIFPEDKEENKSDIKRLILGHTRDEGDQTMANRPMISDAVEGKGKGLVILLHGPPGVGKTLTAELGARAAGRPLYNVAPSDIGLNPSDAEKSFSRLFRLASRWQAVLLIDEAEVFLDTRGPKGESDVEKNALVSVLLRALEYFQGVLVMTTNRVMTIDPAMVSRIHYAVSLGPLDKDQETKIWKSYIGQLDSGNCKDILGIKNWVEKKTKKKTSDMNGRQIRNLFTTAQVLAEGELVEGQSDSTGKISLDHFRRVNETMTTFREDMQALLISARMDAAKP